MNLYSTNDLRPLFEDMHSKIGLSSESFFKQNEIARTIWLCIRIDGEIKNGGIAQLFFNLRSGFDSSLFAEALLTIGSEEGAALLSEFDNFLKADEKRKKAFYEESYFGKGMPKAVNTLHNKLSDQYYKLTPSIESLVLAYAEKNWEDKAFQQSIAHLAFAADKKDEKELIGNLIEAVKNGSTATAKKILKKLSSPNQADEYGFIPLIELASWNTTNSAKKIEMVKLLLEYKADINIQNKYGDTVLHKAAYSGDEDFVNALLDNGANLEQTDKHGRTPIFDSVGNPKANQLLIDKGANLEVLSSIKISVLGAALREYSSWIGNKYAKEYQPKTKKVINQLLKAGVKFHKGMLHDNTSTELSKLVGDADILAHLLKQKSIKDCPEFNPEHRGWSAVFEAAYSGNEKSLKLLIEAGACLNNRLETAHYESKTFVGASPLSVAKNNTISALLKKHQAIEGAREGFSVYMETRGKEAAALAIIKELLQLDEAGAKEKWNTVKKKLGEEYEKVGDEYVIYKPLLLKNCENEEALTAITEMLEAAEAAFLVV